MGKSSIYGSHLSRNISSLSGSRSESCSAVFEVAKGTLGNKHGRVAEQQLLPGAALVQRIFGSVARRGHPRHALGTLGDLYSELGIAIFVAEYAKRQRPSKIEPRKDVQAGEGNVLELFGPEVSRM